MTKEIETTEVLTAAAPSVALTKAEKLEARINMLNTRIEADTAELPRLQAELTAVAQLDSIDVGSQLIIRTGRAESTKLVPAVVQGKAVLPEGTRFKVVVGEGFDTETLTIQPSQVAEIISL